MKMGHVATNENNVCINEAFKCSHLGNIHPVAI